MWVGSLSLLADESLRGSRLIDWSAYFMIWRRGWSSSVGEGFSGLSSHRYTTYLIVVVNVIWPSRISLFVLVAAPSL